MVIYTYLDGKLTTKLRKGGLKYIKSYLEVPKVWIAILSSLEYEYMNAGNGQNWLSSISTIFSNLFVINIHNSVVQGY